MEERGYGGRGAEVGVGLGGCLVAGRVAEGECVVVDFGLGGEV